MLIALDFDDVLADTLPAWLDAYHKASGRRLSLSDITEWDLTKFVPEEDAELIYTVRTPAMYIGRVQPVVGARTYLRRMQNEYGLTFCVLTAEDEADEAMLLVKKYWLESYFPDVRFDFILPTGVTSKREICRHLGVNILVDDNPLNAPSHLFAQPWNAGVTLTEGMRGVNSWEDIYYDIAWNL